MAETAAHESLSPADLWDAWGVLSLPERVEGLRLLRREEGEDLFLGLAAKDQVQLLDGLPAPERRGWARLLPPDDAADLIQAAAVADRDRLLGLFDESLRKEVTALLA